MSTYLKSYYSTTLHNINETELFVKTEDLNTSCGIVFLAHKYFSVVNEDIEFLRSVEKNAFELVLNREADENYNLDEEKIINDLKNIIENTDKYGNGLLITDQEISDVNILQVNSENVNNLHGHFDYILLNLNHSLINVDNERAVESILKIISYIKLEE